METTNEAYQLLTQALDSIETAAAQGILSAADARLCCRQIKTTVYTMRQIINRNFFVPGGFDSPPAA